MKSAGFFRAQFALWKAGAAYSADVYAVVVVLWNC